MSNTQLTTILENISTKPWNWYCISQNLFNHHPYFQSEIYRKRMTKILHDTIHEELISKACHPDRIMNWHEDFYSEYYISCLK